jgi:hypothetical protein
MAAHTGIVNDPDLLQKWNMLHLSLCMADHYFRKVKVAFSGANTTE